MNAFLHPGDLTLYELALIGLVAVVLPVLVFFLVIVAIVVPFRAGENLTLTGDGAKKDKHEQSNK